MFETLEPRLLPSADALGLAAAYAFDETSGTTAADATSHAIVGTLVNGPTWATGKYGNAVNLDGINDYVNLGNPTALQLTGSMTLSGWVNASSFPVDDAAVVSKRISGEIGFQLDVTKDTGPRTIGFKLTNSSGGQMFRYGATTLQTNTWYHIAGVYDAATQSLHVYLDGQLDDGVLQGTVTASQQNSTANVNVGRRAGNTGFEFAGRVDDVRIYERALTAAEIQTDMVTPLVVSPDSTAPSVQAINRLNPTPTNAGSVQWTVAFSEMVTGVDLTDFALVASGVAGATLTGVSGSGSSYTVTAGTGTGDGTLGLTLIDNDSIVDPSANRLGGTGPGNGTFTGQTYTIDKTAPNGTLVINGGAAATNNRNVTLTLSATDAVSSVTQMRFSNTGTSFSAAETYAPTKAWTLSTGAGTKTVYVQYRDGTGNWSTAAITDTIVFDTTAPTISARAATSIASNSATITWTTNEPATSQVNYGLTTSYGSTTTLDPTLLTSHSVTLTGLAPNTTYNYRVRSFDAAGNERVSANSTFVTAVSADAVAPAVQAINRVGLTPTNAGSVQWTVAFSETVAGVDLTDFTLAASGVAEATLTGVSGSGSSYTVTAGSGTSDGTLGLTLVDNDTIVDLSANPLGGTGLGNGNFTGQSYAIDKTAPNVAISQALGQVDPTDTDPINFTVAFSEAVTGFAANDISFAGSTVGGALSAVVSGTGPTYSVTVSGMTGTGDVMASVLAGAATDAAGNASLVSTSTDNTVTFDATVSPTVLSIDRVSTNPTNAASLQWAVTFSESVTGVDAGDFTLVTTGAIASAAIANVSGNGNSYTVTAGTGTGGGTLELDLVDNDTIIDVFSTPLGGAGTGNGSFTGQSYTIDKAAPSVTINQAAGQTDPTSANPINFTVVFSENVTGFTTGDVTLGGTAGATTATVTGSGTTYNVTASGMTANGAVSVTIGAGVASDAAGNASLVSTSADNTVTFTNMQTAGLAAAYAFDETSGTTAADATSHANVGTLINGPTWTTGRYGNAVSLDGANDYLTIPNSASLDISGTALTLSMWINPQAAGGDSVVLGKPWNTTMTSPYYQYGIELAGGTVPVFYVGTTSGVRSAAMGSALALNQWSNLAVVFDGSQAQFYLNGALAATVSLSASITARGNPLRLGADSNTQQFFNGSLDDVRIYDRALTAAEIETDMVTPVSTIGSADPNAPDVHLEQPTDGALVTDIVVVEAHATDDIGVAGVQFFVDGVLTGLLDTVAPYALTWDTRTVSNGAHTLTAQAYDTSGNAAVSQPVTVNVSNANYFRNEILATGFELPTAIKFLPDGRMLVAELTGAIKVLPPPYTSAAPTPFLDLNLDISGYEGLQQGIFDFVLDPDFTTNHYYYVFYTNDSPNRDRLSRFTANATLDGTVPGSEVILYEDPQIPNTEHHGGAINFGNDGKIYFTTGEHFTAGNSQLLNNPRGKIHRINPDGTVPTDNPFYDGTGPNWDSIWAIGLRNPYRAYYDAPTGRLFIGDVGGNDNSNSIEELNVGARGANYGWPNVEGTSTNPAYTNPIYSYPHNGRDAAITSGFVYHGTQFPSSYEGSYFFADYTQNWIRRLTFDANGTVTGVFNFEPADGSVDGPYGDIVYLTEGPDGALYYVDLGYSDVGGTFGISKIRRVQYIQSNLPPVVAVSATPLAGAVPLTVNFSSAGSSDPEGTPLAYSWNFGDGTAVSTEANPTHTYAIAGPYQARLTVSDGVNSTLSTPLSISAGTRPVIANLLVSVPPNPSNNGLFRAGDIISYSAQATDVEDVTLPDSAYTWNIDFLHEGHVHPGTPISGVTGGSFTIPTSGHDFSGNTRYRITLTVTDSDGLQASQSAIVNPDKVNLTFDTTPGGLTLYLDGIAHTAPFVYDTLIGFDHTLEARDQTSSTSMYTFASWSDGGAQLHTLTVPAVPQSYTASYAVVPNPLPSGLTAAYAFDETSGTTATDATSHAIVGTLINGPTWTTGKYGNAVNLDGINDYVNLGNPTALQLTGSMTLSGWVNASSFPVDDAAVVSKRISGEIGFQLDVTKDTGPRTIGFKLTNSSGGQMFRYGATTLQPNTWYHIAGVYDAATQSLHVYLNGQLDDGVLQGTVTASQQNSTANVNIGRRAGNTGFEFAGRVDDVRIYDRSLTATEIQSDMLASLGAPDTVAPSAPTGLTATPVSSAQINLSWTASTDNVAVTGYRVFRDGNEIGTTTTTSYNDIGLAAGTSYGYAIRALDGAGNLSAPSTTVNATTAAPDTIAPSVALTAPASGATLSGTVTITADATDNVSVAGVQFLVDGANLGAEDSASPYSVSWNTTGVANGSHTLLARARDAAGNVTTSSPITVTVANAQTAGLAAGWSFDEASGTLATDSSGNNNTATLVNGVARGTGKYAGGLTFDGVNDYLTIPNSASLNISGTGLTLSMWINPQATGGDSVVLGKPWNTTMTSPYYQYGIELAGGTVPVFYIGTTSGVLSASMGSALALNQWSNLAVVFNGSQAQFYVNSALVTTVSLSASITARGNPLRLGADANTQQFFKGSLDDVRIYARALTAAEIQANMATPL